MNVAGGPPNHRGPERGPAVFNETPRRCSPACRSVVWFPEGAGGDRFEKRFSKGRWHGMTRAKGPGYIQRVTSYARPSSNTRTAPRPRGFGTSLPPSRKPLVNAVYHRSYEERRPIEVRISNEELVILASRPGSVDPDGGLSGWARSQPALLQPADRGVPEGTGDDGRALHRHRKFTEGNGVTAHLRRCSGQTTASRS